MTTGRKRGIAAVAAALAWLAVPGTGAAPAGAAPAGTTRGAVTDRPAAVVPAAGPAARTPIPVGPAPAAAEPAPAAAPPAPAAPASAPAATHAPAAAEPAAAAPPAPVPSPAAPEPVLVRLSNPGAVVVHPRRQIAATVVARNETRVAAEIASAVVEVLAEVGQTVLRGDVLARLDDEDWRLALERAQAQRDAAAAKAQLAERQLVRTRELQQNNFVSSEALNQRESEVASQKAELRALEVQVATARRQLDRTLVRAPFDAVVRTRSAQLGELTNPGTPMFVLTQTSGAEVSVRVPLDEAEPFMQSREPLFESAGRRFPVKVLRVSPVVDPEGRTREARLVFLGAAPPPGTEGRLSWQDPRAHLPADVFVRRDGQLGVFVETAGKARFVPTPDAQEGRPAIVDLPEPSRVVVRGQALLTEGDPVRAGAPR
jgi:RND family efflux transporter MFP subunit